MTDRFVFYSFAQELIAGKNKTAACSAEQVLTSAPQNLCYKYRDYWQTFESTRSAEHFFDDVEDNCKLAILTKSSGKYMYNVNKKRGVFP